MATGREAVEQGSATGGWIRAARLRRLRSKWSRRWRTPDAVHGRNVRPLGRVRSLGERRSSQSIVERVQDSLWPGLPCTDAFPSREDLQENALVWSEKLALALLFILAEEEKP